MKFFITVLLLCSGTAVINGRPKFRMANRGEVASEAEFPYQVSIQLEDVLTGKSQHICGGALISKTVVLTAAHCVQNEIDQGGFSGTLKVEVGSTQIGKGTTHEVKRVSYYRLHNGHSQTHVVPNDIAVVHLTTPVKTSNRVAIINLPEANSTPAPGTTLILSGFGNSFLQGPTSPVLKKMESTVVSKEECQQYYLSLLHLQVSDDKICTKRGPGYGACRGDSGGPLVDKTKKTVVGVVSAGDGECSNGQPDTYTDVSKFLPYIKEELNYKPGSTNSNPAINFDGSNINPLLPQGQNPGSWLGQQPQQILPPGFYPGGLPGQPIFGWPQQQVVANPPFLVPGQYPWY